MADPVSTVTGMRGMTLIELLVVLAIVGILLMAGSWGSAAIVQRWQALRGVHQLFEDCKEAQAYAERTGGVVLSDGALVTTRSFLVFEPEVRRYALFAWQDGDGDGRPEAGESHRIWTRELPPSVRFGWAAGIERKACSNVIGTPTAAITFGTAGYPPCDGRPCLKFDQQGFSSMGPGAVYLVDGTESFALTVTRPGHFTLCRWDGRQWR
jgi:prepilin-type N-terminal cleavage/methylation domain-containing protein